MDAGKLLEVGDIIKIEKGHTVYTMVPEHFVYKNKKGCFDLTRSGITISTETEFLGGLYIVSATTKDGGGSGSRPGENYPDGHHVWCQKENGLEKIDFYQTGCFTAMIKNIEPVGTASFIWHLPNALKEAENDC